MRPLRALCTLLSLGLPLGLLTGCMAPPLETSATPTRAAQQALPDLPPMKLFAASGAPDSLPISNADLARDFLDLSFQLESGRSLPVFTRFEGQIRVGLAGQVPPGMARDLDAVIARLRREAGIDIIRLPSGYEGNLNINAVPGEEIRKELPAAACFVVPGITRLSQYRQARRQDRTDWTRLKTRSKLAIFVPSDAAPQETRDCLHEELAQALGPLNDLYRLPDSTFNDDNIHSILTRYDMLILRMTYAPELRSGMSRAEVQARLPDLLDRLNPGGRNVAPRHLGATPQAWMNEVARALGPGISPANRVRGARQAVALAQSYGWTDHRLAFSYYMLGRLSQSQDPRAAHRYLLQAHQLYSRDRGTRLHAAHTAVQLAAFALAGGDPEKALALLSGRAQVAREYQNAMLLANIEMLRAEALEQTGQPQEARRVRLDSLGWARYGFGPDWAVRARLQEIAALNPARGKSL
ncbi:Protein of unknown function [Pseudooceanicola antarcticus]|uniref:DUF2927 domain-containing protein n=1 Tax=Pseudooceanicola antarcticus TaxID=1247613 RepID=A0A285J0F9_9RHOB|nr:DUF2927 domain-containing protein [Pseudooceanicola antarcticus]PJE29948.1 DUF2927 domain-containing protein [Pseudooceanicola antarcticus]SNY53785.1 Protein of unknown function [Pseudooceanicola antarcticus]